MWEVPVGSAAITAVISIIITAAHLPESHTLGPPSTPPDSSCSPLWSFALAGPPSGNTCPPTSPFSPLRSQLKCHLLRRPSWIASANMSPLYYLNLFYFLPSTQNHRKSSQSLFVYRQQNWKRRGRKDFVPLVYSWELLMSSSGCFLSGLSAAPYSPWGQLCTSMSISVTPSLLPWLRSICFLKPFFLCPCVSMPLCLNGWSESVCIANFPPKGWE